MTRMYSTFDQGRLQLAQFLAKQQGWTWTGVTAEERDALLDAAGSTLTELEGKLDAIHSAQLDELMAEHQAARARNATF